MCTCCRLRFSLSSCWLWMVRVCASTSAADLWTCWWCSTRPPHSPSSAFTISSSMRGPTCVDHDLANKDLDLANKSLELANKDPELTNKNLPQALCIHNTQQRQHSATLSSVFFVSSLSCRSWLLSKGPAL